jgi:hypothetical protein
LEHVHNKCQIPVLLHHTEQYATTNMCMCVPDCLYLTQEALFIVGKPVRGTNHHSHQMQQEINLFRWSTRSLKTGDYHCFSPDHMCMRAPQPSVQAAYSERTDDASTPVMHHSCHMLEAAV